MKISKHAVLLLIIVGFISIQLAAFLDEPQHLLEPDPDCPICLAVQSPVCLNLDISINFTPDIILYLADNTVVNPKTSFFLTVLSIRAPPIT